MGKKYEKMETLDMNKIERFQSLLSREWGRNCKRKNSPTPKNDSVSIPFKQGMGKKSVYAGVQVSPGVHGFNPF